MCPVVKDDEGIIRILSHKEVELLIVTQLKGPYKLTTGEFKGKVISRNGTSIEFQDSSGRTRHYQDSQFTPESMRRIDFELREINYQQIKELLISTSNHKLPK